MADAGVLLEYDVYNDKYSIRSDLPNEFGLLYVDTDRYGLVILMEGQDMEAYVRERSACEELGIYKYDIVTGD